MQVSTITFPFRSNIFCTNSGFFSEFNADSERFKILVVKRGKEGTNLTNLSVIRCLLWPSLPHFFVLIHWSLAFMNK